MWIFKRNNRTELMKYLDSFKKTKRKLMQIDIFDENENILLQIFKGSDVYLWEKEFKRAVLDKEINESFIFLIQFNEVKENNLLNLCRFKESDWSSRFYKKKLYGQKFYFHILPFDDSKIIEVKIRDILRTVYNLQKEDKLKFTLSGPKN
ncbi:MAG TPA: hypothetical protein VK050_05825 [Flavobacteriaceae bacterium]|nr:hypothetical protein [Flavobacteriaceae bacterium]